MSSTRRKGIHILITTFVAVIMVATMAAPALAQQGPEIRVTHFESLAGEQVVAVDSEGNVHIAYSVYPEGFSDSPVEPLDQADRWGDFASLAEDHDSNPQSNRSNGYGWEIWYTMLDNNGNTLIDDTLLTDIAEADSDFPAIVVDSEDKVHIVWLEREFDDLFYTKLDPSLDDQNGDAADESVITLIDDTRLTFFEDVYWGGQIAIDSSDRIHIVFQHYWQEIYYMQIDNEGNINIDPIMLELASEWTFFSVAVDSNNNAHIAWDELYEYDDDYYENGGHSYEIYYMMLDGSDGDTLIDATMITPDDGKKSKRPSIVVDFQDRVHIIWQDRRGVEMEERTDPRTEIYHTKLDPSLDDRDGDAAAESAITLIDDHELTPNDGGKSNHPTSAISCGRYIHLTWSEGLEGEEEFAYLHYMVLDDDGSIVVADTALITEQTLYPWSLANLDVDSNGKAHIVWCDNRDGGWDYCEVYYTNYEGQPEFSATPTAGPTPLEVQFTDESAPDFNSWSWDFGDGGTSNEQNPMHVYTRPGPFTVSLNVSGPCGSEIETKVDYIHPYSTGVGGEAYPVNKLFIVLPWFVLGMAIMTGSFVVVRRRSTKA